MSLRRAVSIEKYPIANKIMYLRESTVEWVKAVLSTAARRK